MIPSRTNTPTPNSTDDCFIYSRSTKFSGNRGWKPLPQKNKL
jgi:hypothetical protein